MSNSLEASTCPLTLFYICPAAFCPTPTVPYEPWDPVNELHSLQRGGLSDQVKSFPAVLHNLLQGTGQNLMSEEAQALVSLFTSDFKCQTFFPPPFFPPPPPSECIYHMRQARSSVSD